MSKSTNSAPASISAIAQRCNCAAATQSGSFLNGWTDGIDAYFHPATLKICHAEKRVIIKKKKKKKKRKKADLNDTQSGRQEEERNKRQRETTAEMDRCEREREGSERWEMSIWVAEEQGGRGQERRHKYASPWAIFVEELWRLLQARAKAPLSFSFLFPSAPSHIFLSSLNLFPVFSFFLIYK